MIILGVILLLIAYLLPDVVPTVPPGILHVCSVLGWIALVVGLILLVLGQLRPNTRLGGRRYWY
jgi:hypothetical protein